MIFGRIPCMTRVNLANYPFEEFGERHSQYEIPSCCQDYKNISGECIACIGSFGHNCSNTCINGYYGHGCREQCNCSQNQTCDRERGCIVPNTSYSNLNICKLGDGTETCCNDYRNISGKCTACIGSFGKGCLNPCSYGYYGHGCRERCDCTEDQICDKSIGCLDSHDYYINKTKEQYQRSDEINSSLQFMIIIISGVLALVFIVLGIVCYLRSKLTENGSNTNTDVTESLPSGIVCSIQQEQGECIYNDVRESRMIENTRMIQQENVSMQKRSKLMRTCTSVPKQRIEKVQESTSSCSFDPGNYGGCSDTYSQLHLKNMRTSTLPSKTSVNMNDYALMEKENFKEDEYANQSIQENPIIARSGVNQSRIFRPYSSVKYNRNVDKE